MMTLSARSRGAAQARAQHSYAARHVLLPVQRFLQTEVSSGALLLLAAAAALIWANSRWSASYASLWHTPAALQFGSFSISHDLREWINDAFMVVFFFVVGLEVKREFMHGELADPRRAALPVTAAVGGMLVPALFYAALNWHGATARGWGIPMATDIAFAVSVLALVGDRVPPAARVFLLALATVDDIGAILVIAIVYTEGLSVGPLMLALFLIAVIIGMRRFGVSNLLYYVPVGVLLWFAVLQSGVHATIAGVVMGLLTPARPHFNSAQFVRRAAESLHNYEAAVAARDHETAEALLGELDQLTSDTESPADRLLRLLHPWSSYVILPLFALANAGVLISRSAAAAALTSRISLGVVLGLVIGKVVGITLFTLLATRWGLARMIHSVDRMQLVGIGLLGGIGFTVSLFISDLAFADVPMIEQAKLGIVAGSVLSAVAGYVVLRCRKHPA